MQKKMKQKFFITTVVALILGVLFAGQAIAAGAEDANFTYKMSTTNVALCKSATSKPASSSNPQNFIDRCVLNVTAYCTAFNNPVYKNACFGKYFGLGDCRQTGSTSMEQMGVKACKEKNTFICAAQPQASFKTSCQNAGKSQLFGIFVTDSGGGSTEAGGGSRPTSGEEAAAGTGSEASTETEEDKGLTAEEINAQAEELRNKLAKGSNDCGDSKTVFDFNCSGSGNGILQLLYAFVRFTTYGVGIIITLSIVISGIQYTSAQGDTNTVTKARMRIFNAVIALLLYVFAFALLNYLVPGGLITT